MRFFQKMRDKTRQKPQDPLDTDFMRSLIFEENPFENEEPAVTRIYDVDGNELEVHIHEQKRPTRNHGR